MLSRTVCAATLSLGLLAASCGGGDTVQVGGQDANDHGRTDVAGQGSVAFELDDFYFEPTILEGEPGQRITLEARNEGDESHTITIESQGIDEVFDPGAERPVEVTFPDSGELVFVCRFHDGQGMRGALIASREGGAAPGDTPVDESPAQETPQEETGGSPTGDGDYGY